eukprot:gene9425-12700_t
MSVTIHTNYGNMKMEVYCDTVPKNAENFLALCASNSYDGTLFHRNLKGFMIQGGDPTNTGKGGSSVWGSSVKDEFTVEQKHDKRGVVSMANNGPDTNGSQFFICYGPQPHLNNKYTIIGQVIDGLEVLDAMEKVQVGNKNRPLVDIKIEKITIHANPLAG